MVIPCYDEPDLIPTLQSLTDGHLINGKVEVIVVVNQSTADSAEIVKRNKQTISFSQQWVDKQSTNIKFHFLHQELPAKWAGVGLARKIGMDEAVRRFHQLDKDGIIVCLDADCTCSVNYLQAIEAHFTSNNQTPGCAIYFEHTEDSKSKREQHTEDSKGKREQHTEDSKSKSEEHTGSKSEREQHTGSMSLEQLSRSKNPEAGANSQGIASYELHLRYYTHALQYCGLPCAFQTVGSAMAVRSSAYQKQGGMNKRKAGEDFYFLQKIIKLGGFSNLKSATVYPSSRPSQRVPFGTGRAMLALGQQPVPAYMTYHPNTFLDLKKFTDGLPDLFQASSSRTDLIWESLSPAFQGFISKSKFTATIQQVNQKTNGWDNFEKRFFHWVDGFFAFKFANYARAFYPEVNVSEAAGWLLNQAYGLQPVSDDVLEILMEFRALDNGATARR
ncbi:MAG: hypothetical protein DHS20C17_08970 [Cyclobacteriaceae bacterium]|nr:MAG: hypothetical protein DHS20C17_08970 [Cyclobacteriaceae bacterium]